MEGTAFSTSQGASCSILSYFSSSSSTRAFIENNYKVLKIKNPKLPILICEASGIEPQLWARYDLGIERGMSLDGLNEEQMLKVLENLAKGPDIKG